MDTQQQYQRIWHVVQLIPLGKVASYGQVADLAGLPGRARLAGKALGYVPESGYRGQNVPWQRVLRSSGQLAFPPGSDQFELQKSLLLEEGVICKGRTVPLKRFQWRPQLDELLFSLQH